MRILLIISWALLFGTPIIGQDLLSIGVATLDQGELAQAIACESETRSMMTIGLQSSDPATRCQAAMAIQYLKDDQTAMTDVLHSHLASETDPIAARILQDMAVTAKQMMLPAELAKETGELEIAAKLRAMGLQVAIDATGYVRDVSSGTYHSLRDSDVKLLLGLSHLKILQLHGQKHLSTDAVSRLRTLRSLEYLVVPSTIGDAGLEWLGDAPNLTSFNGDGISDKSLEVLSKSTSLKHIFLYSPHLTDDGLRHLSRVSTLEIVFLGPQFTARGVSYLTALPLKSIKVTQSDDITLNHLSAISNLSSAYLGNCESATPAGFKRLATIQSLRYLSFNGLDRACFQILQDFPSLEELRLAEICPEHVETLLACQKLTRIVVEQQFELPEQDELKLQQRFTIYNLGLARQR